MSRSVEAVQTFGKKVMAETCTCIYEREYRAAVQWGRCVLNRR